jgi:hypothetical protein
MTRATMPTRFFLEVHRPPREMVLVWGVVLAFAAWRLATANADLNELTIVVLFAQMFGVSSGYRDRLRRGHYDPILVGPRSRVDVAAAHWAVSAAPGSLTLLLAVVAYRIVAPSSTAGVSYAPMLVALLCVSTLAWTISVPTGRYVGGTLWTIGVLVLAAGPWIWELRSLLLDTADGWATAARQAGAVLACPFLLVSSTVQVDSRTLVVAALLSSAAWAAGVVMIVRLDALLEDANR